MHHGSFASWLIAAGFTVSWAHDGLQPPLSAPSAMDFSTRGARWEPRPAAGRDLPELKGAWLSGMSFSGCSP